MLQRDSFFQPLTLFVDLVAKSKLPIGYHVPGTAAYRQAVSLEGLFLRGFSVCGVPLEVTETTLTGRDSELGKYLALIPLGKDDFESL